MGVGNLLTIVRSTTTSIYSATGHFAFTVVMTAVALIVTTLASIVAVLLGAGPTTLAAIYLVVSGAGSLDLFSLGYRDAGSPIGSAARRRRR